LPVPFEPASVASAPDAEGVHVVRAEEGVVLYVGRSRETRRRLRQHLSGPRESSVLHKRVAELLDVQLRRPATGADVRDYLSRCTVEWIETTESEELKARLVEELRPVFSRTHGDGGSSGAPLGPPEPEPPGERPIAHVPEALEELRAQLLPYIGIRFQHLAQRPLNPNDRSLARRVISELVTRTPEIEEGHWLTVSIDPDGGVPQEQASITSDFDFDALQAVAFEESDLERHLRALLLVPVVKASSREPEEWYFVEPIVFTPDAETIEQYRRDYEDLRDLVSEGPPDDEWRALGRTGRHLRAKTNYTASNPTRPYSDRYGRRHEPKRRGWYFATGYTADVVAEVGVDAARRDFADEAGLAELLGSVRSLRRAAGRPHKPYLLLCALARLLEDAPRLAAYDTWHGLLEPLLVAEAPDQTPHPEYPFVRLVRDGLWEVAGLSDDELAGDVTPRRLRTLGVEGGLPVDVHQLLVADGEARRAFAYAALAHLDPGQRRIVIEALGMQGTVDVGAVPQPPRPAHEPSQPPLPSTDAPETPAGGEIAAGERAALEEEWRDLGRQGELWVLDVERERLEAAGRPDLADRIDHVGARVDGPGYDICSFDPQTGAELLIEVKTTAGGPRTAYFFTDNELRVSREEADRYRLYRVYDFGDDPRYFVLEGPLDGPYFTRPRVYSAHPQWAPRDQPSGP
jgi:hypothetical protein